MTKDEWAEKRQRVYEGHSPEQVLTAAERILKAADGDDFSFAYPGDNELIANRRILVFAVLATVSGSYTFKIKATRENGGTVVSLRISSELSEHFTGTDTAVERTPAAYDLFWSRLNYALGRSDVWYSCEDFKTEMEKGLSRGWTEALCINAEDHRLAR